MERVTKREILHYLETMQGEITDIQNRSDSIGDSENRCTADTLEAVSYTHLTLPTSDLV